jgi:hypothetical protein
MFIHVHFLYINKHVVDYLKIYQIPVFGWYVTKMCDLCYLTARKVRSSVRQCYFCFYFNKQKRKGEALVAILTPP